MKFLSILAVLLGLFVISPSVVYGGVASATSLLQQQIYNVTEIDSPSPYHITLVIRTGLNTENVWIQRADGSKDKGILISYGEYQRVWQMSHMITQGDSRSLVINANHALVTDESLVSQIFQVGSSSNAIISPTQIITQSENMPTEIHHIITVQNRGHGTQSVSISTTATWRGINIIGDEKFVERTLRAMEVVEQGPRWAYNYVTAYLEYVRQHCTPKRTGTGGHINVKTRTFYVYSITYTGHAMWYAGALVHEAVHSRQFREYLESYGDRTPRRITFYTTFEDQMRIEMEALDIQIRFLEDAGASRYLIEMAQSFIGLNLTHK